MQTPEQAGSLRYYRLASSRPSVLRLLRVPLSDSARKDHGRGRARPGGVAYNLGSTPLSGELAEKHTAYRLSEAAPPATRLFRCAVSRCETCSLQSTPSRVSITLPFLPVALAIHNVRVYPAIIAQMPAIMRARGILTHDQETSLALNMPAPILMSRYSRKAGEPIAHAKESLHA